MRRRIKSILLILIISISFAPAAQAQFGGIVFDPRNYVQNLYTASHSLIQIRQQVQELQNQARMLVGQAKDLTSLDYNAQADLAQILRQMSALNAQAQNVSYQVERTKRLMQAQYPKDYAKLSKQQVLSTAETQWDNARTAFEDSIVLQSHIISNMKADTHTLDQLLSKSQSATGNLSVNQAGNQLLALLITQIMHMQQMDAVQDRALALDHARRLAIEKESRQQHKRFVGRKTAYHKQTHLKAADLKTGRGRP